MYIISDLNKVLHKYRGWNYTQNKMEKMADTVFLHLFNILLLNFTGWHLLLERKHILIWEDPKKGTELRFLFFVPFLKPFPVGGNSCIVTSEHNVILAAASSWLRCAKFTVMTGWLLNCQGKINKYKNGNMWQF